MQWGIALKRPTVANLIAKIALQSCVYHIWAEKNSRLHTQNAYLHEEVINLVKHDVRNRIHSIPRLDSTCLSQNLLSAWC